MSNFLFDLVANLAILTTLLTACHLCNLAKPDLALNGGYVFAVLVATAMLLDAALTFSGVCGRTKPLWEIQFTGGVRSARQCLCACLRDRRVRCAACAHEPCK